jgi:L-lactate utilization protein LutC
VYAIGETATDIILSKADSQLLLTILGENHIFCLQLNGVLKYQKKISNEVSCITRYTHQNSGAFEAITSLTWIR